jgi:pimeloyl-ACP methyl ester carboxylesterase
VTIEHSHRSRSSFPLLAALMSGTYLYRKLKNRDVEAKFPPLGQFISVEDVRLHYVSKGKGRAIVFLHGNEGQLQDFTMSVFDRAAQNYRAIAFDRPGHGYSERPHGKNWSPLEQARYIHDALIKLKVERPILVGHSWSGSLVFAYALEYPDEVAGIVLLSGEVYSYEIPYHSRIALIPALGRLIASTLYVPFGRFVVEAGLKRAFAPDPVPPEYAQVFAAFSLRPNQIKASAEDHRNANHFYAEMSERYHEIRVPTVIMTGDADSIVSPERAYRLHQALPNSKLVVLPDSGHELAFTHPDAVMNAICEVHKRSAEKDEAMSV